MKEAINYLRLSGKQAQKLREELYAVPTPMTLHAFLGSPASQHSGGAPSRPASQHTCGAAPSLPLSSTTAAAAPAAAVAASSHRPAGDPSDQTTWYAREARKCTVKRPAWNPITGMAVVAVRKKQGRPTRDTLGKVWLDWAGEYVDPADPRAQPPFVDPAAVREMEVRLEKEQQRVAKHQAPADVKPHQRGAEPCVFR